MRNAVGRFLLSLLGLLLILPALARAEDEIDFNILDREGMLTVWISLGPLISSSQADRLREGIDLVIEYQCHLAIPRRFLGEASVLSKDGAMTVSYRSVTRDYQLAPLGTPPDSGRVFLSFAHLNDHLTDSITIPLVALDSLDDRKRYTLELKVALISMTEFSQVPEPSDTVKAESPLKYLFRQFLTLTAFGREEYRTKSRAFSPSEIVPES